jgi:RNA polymerase sigma-70 factor (ECF subfamily)
MGEGMEDDAFRRGDARALAEAYRRFLPVIVRYVRRRLFRLGFYDEASQRDVVQEIFVQAFSTAARTTYDPLRPYAPFLRGVARRVLANWLRRTQRERLARVPLDDQIGGHEPLNADAGHLPETLAAAFKYVQALPPELKAVHVQRFVLNEPQLRAARNLGLSRQRIRTLERKLLDGLRDKLRDVDSFDP